MRLTICKMGLVLLLSLVFAPSTAAQIDRWGYWENGVSESWWFSTDEFTQLQADAAIAKWNQLGVELRATATNDWTGDYFRGGETHGSYLRWSKSGFVIVHVDKCQAKVMGLSYGSVGLSTGLPTLIEQFNNNPKSQGHAHNPGLPTTLFVPIKWRGDFLLIEEREMPNFGEYVAGLGKYNGFMELLYDEFYRKLTTASEKYSEHSEPQMPNGFEHHLKKPITTSIISVNSRQIRKSYSYKNPDGTGASYFEPVSLYTVTIDAGRDQALKPRMLLHVSHPREGDDVRILRVNKSTSTGVIIRNIVDGKEIFFDEESKQFEHSKIAKGWHLTTSPFH
jgi:hypothetical protein